MQIRFPSDIESVCMARGGKSQYCRNCKYSDKACNRYRKNHSDLTPKEFYHKYLSQFYNKRKGD